MDGKVSHELTRRHLVVRVEGRYAIADLLRALTEGVGALEPGERALVLIDARASTASHSSAEIREIGMEVGALAPKIERLAVVVGSEAHFGLARMGSMFAGEVAASVEVFREVTPARAYVDLPPEP
jgi:hypothetical protein